MNLSLTPKASFIASKPFSCLIQNAFIVIFRAQFSLIGCLFQSLNEDFGCTRDDLSSLISTPAVRNGFLNDIPIDCSTWFYLFIISTNKQPIFF